MLTNKFFATFFRARLDIYQERSTFLYKKFSFSCHFVKKPYLCISVFHGIRFKVNERLVVVRQPSFFIPILLTGHIGLIGFMGLIG